MGLSYEAVSPPQQARFPLLDPLRGIAAIGVLLVHTSIFSGALNGPVYGDLLLQLDVGVPIFFLLSAFVLYRPFVEARVSGTARTRFSDYGRRRFVRIMPAYWAVLTITAIVPGMAGAFTGNWWAYYGLLQNHPIYEPEGTCAVDPFRCGVPVAWTLTVEVLFYLTLPLLVLAMAWLARHTRARWLWVELGVLVTLSAISLVIQSTPPISELHRWLFYSPLGRAWWFALGLALAAVSVHVAHQRSEPAFVAWLRRHPGSSAVAAVVLYVLVATRTGASLAFPPKADQGRYVRAYLLTGVVATLLLLPAIFGADGGGLVRRALGSALLRWLGLVSYGIYLWHFPVMIFVLDQGISEFWPLTALTLAGTLACSAASFRLLEQPLMRWTRRPVTAVRAAAT